ncbi:MULTISPECIES: DUF1839 family protein [Kocuria]|uniref:DUF1839 family protein n=1 Tax=Kocuria subflava TaxID=1736139 RepID=A0A846U716_9MICC|nr:MULTISPECIES: DUF1839 family protein [Kocuria]NKE09416.1 DUF1839 family protein [Kocuria subflava]
MSAGPATSAVFPGLSAEGFTPHPLHQDQSLWSNTNCYLDVWVELLHGMGRRPEPLFAAAVAAETQVEQFEFLKVDHRDLEEVHGLRVGEYDVWKPLLEHVLTQMAAGNLMIIEADAHWLPDTRGISYGTEHTKTSIVPLRVDPQQRHLVYLHNEGLHELRGQDFDFVLGEQRSQGIVPAPYVELVRLDRLGAANDDDARAHTVRLLRHHALRATAHNPVAELMDVVRSHFDWLAEAGMDGYHALCFETTRQLGVVSMLAAEAVRFSAVEEIQGAAEAYVTVSKESKALQFQLARVARGRKSASLETTMATISEQWALAAATLREWAGP